LQESLDVPEAWSLKASSIDGFMKRGDLNSGAPNHQQSIVILIRSFKILFFFSFSFLSLLFFFLFFFSFPFSFFFFFFFSCFFSFFFSSSRFYSFILYYFVLRSFCASYVPNPAHRERRIPKAEQFP